MSLFAGLSQSLNKLKESVLNITEVKYLTQGGYKDVAAGVLLPVAATVPAVQTAAIGLASVGKTVAKSAGSLVSKVYQSLTPIGKVKAIAVTPLVALTVAKTPMIQQKIYNLPATYDSLSTGISTFIQDPSLTSGKTLVTEHPYATVAAGGATLSAVIPTVFKIAGVITASRLNNAIQDQTDALKDANPASTSSSPNKSEIKAQADAQIDIIKAQTESASHLLKEQVKAQEESLKLEKKYRTIQPISELTVGSTTPVPTVSTFSEQQIQYAIEKERRSEVAKLKRKKKAKPKKKAKKKPKKKAKKKKSLNTKKKKKVKR